MNKHRLERYDKTDNRKTYQEYRNGIVIGGKTTMTDAQRKRARAKRKKSKR